jgi:hypothetical protein
MNRLAALLLVVPCVAAAAPDDGLKPMAFLAGHCWKGAFADGKQTDEHCFSWIFDPHALRDVHTVRAPGRPDYVGETTYYWDSAAKRVAYLYVENAGGISRGTMEPGDGVLDFPATQYVANGEAMTYRVRWTVMGDRAYEAFSEAQVNGAWSTMFRYVLQRVDK